MTRPKQLDDAAIRAWLASRSGWEQSAPRIASAPGVAGLRKTFPFSDYGAAVAFVVRVALAAEKHDHHPDLRLTYGHVDVFWSTHDAGGVTELDQRLADVCDAFTMAG